ncbi:MAG: hypothetical protein LBH43_11880 [Treponema sp.]|nr:hypothetical protein [Treponema sp.]
MIISEGLFTTNPDSSTLLKIPESLSSPKYSPFDGSGPSIFTRYLSMRIFLAKIKKAKSF